MLKCLLVTHWKHRMEILQIQRHPQEVFAIPLFPVDFRDRWPTTVFDVCKVSELQWYPFLVASFSVLCVAVLLLFCFVSMLNWAFAKAWLTGTMQALFHFSCIVQLRLIEWHSSPGKHKWLFQPHLRKIFYFSHSFSKTICSVKWNLVFNAFVTQPLYLTVTFSDV